MRVKQRHTVAAIALAMALLAAMIVSIIALHGRSPPRATAVEAPELAPPPRSDEAPAMSIAELPPPIAPPAPPIDVFLIATTADGVYALLDVDWNLPKHGRPRLVDGDTWIAVADIAQRDVPARLRKLQRQGMKVDGSCEARVAGFVVIARVSGVLYDDDRNALDWNAERVMATGVNYLAARLEGCSGTYARPAALPDIEMFSETDHVLVGQARERFVASQMVEDDQREWRAHDRDGEWYTDVDGNLAARVFTHPRTGVDWIVVHAYRFGDCGEPGGNVLGLYRVEGDKLIDVQLRGGNVERIDGLLDIDRDGVPELVGSSNFETQIDRADGSSVTHISVTDANDGDCKC